MSQQPHLHGVGVLVTRPAAQAEELCALIEAAGGRAVRFPTLVISPAPDADAARAALASLEQYDLILFVSANAVEQALALRPVAQWPTDSRYAALGAGTVRALARHGLTAQWVAPPPHDSEALLALLPLHPHRSIQSRNRSNFHVFIARHPQGGAGVEQQGGCHSV